MMKSKEYDKTMNIILKIYTFVIPLVIPKRFLASQVSKLDVPYIIYFPLNLSKLRPRSQSSPAIQSRIRSIPSGNILQD